MAVRRPLILVNGEFKPMTDQQITAVRYRAAYLYGNNPTTTLSYVASDGNLNAMDDTRYQAGDYTKRTNRYSTEEETPDISIVTTTFDHLDQSYLSGLSYTTDTDNRAFPLYITSTGDFRAMTLDDFNDTFIFPAIDRLVSPALPNQGAGTYYVLESAETVPQYLEPVGGDFDTNPIFINTIADKDAYTSGGIPEAKDQPSSTVQSYYLYKYKSTSVTPETMFYLTSDDHMREYTLSELDSLLLTNIQKATSSEVGYRIRYEINSTDGTTRGTAMVDEQLNGTSEDGYTRRFVNADDYRTQEFPNGVPIAANTYRLKIRQV